MSCRASASPAGPGGTAGAGVRSAARHAAAHSRSSWKREAGLPGERLISAASPECAARGPGPADGSGSGSGAGSFAVPGSSRAAKVPLPGRNSTYPSPARSS